MTIATLRECEYERHHHVRIGRKAGVTAEQIEHLGDVAWTGWTPRERALVEATTQFVRDKNVDDAAWSGLREHLNDADSIEFLLLCGQYDSLATVLLTLKVQLD